MMDAMANATSSHILRRFCAMRVYTSTGRVTVGVISSRRQADFDVLPNPLLRFEERHGLEMVAAGNQVSREALDGCVVFQRIHVIELPGVGDFFFGVGQLRLQLVEAG